MKHILLTAILLLPFAASAQGLQTYIPSLLTFINTVIVPLILGIAFLVFVINTVRYFVANSSSEEGREKAKGFMLYSIFAFVFIIVFWGIINLLISTTDLGGCNPPMSDYQQFQMSGTDGAPWAPDCPI